MKIILSIAIVSFLTIVSCSKHDSLEKGKVLSERKNETNILSFNPEPNKLPKAYILLVNKLKTRTITFDEFYSQLQVLLKPYKRKGANKGPSTISGRQFGPWSYIPSYCDSDNDPLGCREFWRTECMSFCLDKFYMVNEATMLLEESKYVEYRTALNLCNITNGDSTNLDSCKNAAAIAYATSLITIMADYNEANNNLYTCEMGCEY